ncbi:hypothetical protein KKG31_07725 [Patescibacteria group bacterium]|nr:hypothetical protein [Patescibacteria group bacterium]
MIIKNSIRKIFIVLGISSLFFAITSFSSADYFVNDTNIYTTRSDYIQNLSVGLGALKPDNINELIFEYCVSILG